MKIVLVCNSTNPDLEKYFNLYGKSLPSRYIIRVGNKKIKNVSRYTLSISDKSVPSIKSFYSIFASFKILLAKEIKKAKIVHFTTAHFDNLFFAFLVRFFTNKKMIFTIHDKEPHPGLKSHPVRLYNWIVEKLLADDIIFFCKKYHVPSLNNHYQTLAGFSQRITESKGGRYFLFFGRIDKYKGIKKLWHIAKKMPDQKFMVAGKGKCNFLEKLKKLNNVTVKNRFIGENEFLELFKNASLTLLPYTSATQSGVIILSYAHATPVMTFSVGCLDNYVSEDTGWLFSPDNSEGLIKKLGNLTKNEIKKKSDSITNIYQNKFSGDNFKVEYRKILGEIGYLSNYVIK